MRARKVQVDSKYATYSYFDNCSCKANNLVNAVRFRQRQAITAVSKNDADWTDNEREIMAEIKNALPTMGKKYNMPTAGQLFLSYRFLDTLQKAADNFEPIYRAPPNAKLWTGQFTQIFFDFSTQNQTYLF